MVLLPMLVSLGGAWENLLVVFLLYWESNLLYLSSLWRYLDNKHVKDVGYGRLWLENDFILVCQQLNLSLNLLEEDEINVYPFAKRMISKFHIFLGRVIIILINLLLYD